MNIWITGGKGTKRPNFIVAWLREHLEATGEHDVFASSWDATERERDDFVQVMRSSKANVIIHGDELRGEYACRKQPLTAAEVNVGTTAMLAQAAAEAVVPFVYLSTSEATIGQDLFGLTKLAGEQAAWLYAQKTGVQIIRLYGVYGPGVRGIDAPMPNRFVEQALVPEGILAHDSIHRGWTYVSDAVRAIRLIVEDGRPGIWSVGRWDNDLTMFDLAQRACTVAGRDPSVLVGKAGWPPAAHMSKSPDTTAVRSLGWEPEVSLEDGLRDTAAWMLRPGDHEPGHSVRV